MNFELPESVRELRARVEGFIQCRVIACEPIYFEQLSDPSMRWRLVPILKELREEARSQGFWNFPLGRHLQGRDMTLSNYAPIAEVISQSPFGSEVFNCYSGTVLNAQLLDQFASEGVKSEFLDPLVRGEIRACIAITEPHVPASDPTSLGLTAVRDGNEYVINGQKSWATGMMMEECRAILLLACTSPQAEPHQRHSIVVVSRDAKGVTIGENQSAFGYDHAPYGHPDIAFEDVRVPVHHLLGDEGSGFRLMQTGLGFGRVQIGMGAVGGAIHGLAGARPRYSVSRRGWHIASSAAC